MKRNKINSNYNTIFLYSWDLNSSILFLPFSSTELIIFFFFLFYNLIHFPKSILSYLFVWFTYWTSLFFLLISYICRNYFFITDHFTRHILLSTSPLQRITSSFDPSSLLFPLLSFFIQFSFNIFADLLLPSQFFSVPILPVFLFTYFHASLFLSHSLSLSFYFLPFF